MNRIIAGRLLGIFGSASIGAFATRGSGDTMTYQHQIEQLRAEQARQAATARQSAYAYEAQTSGPSVLGAPLSR